jgi:hypothetical protein
MDWWLKPGTLEGKHINENETKNNSNIWKFLKEAQSYNSSPKNVSSCGRANGTQAERNVSKS